MGRLQSKYEKLFLWGKVQLITTKDRISIAFHLSPGKTADAKAL
jgi:hypothetical protein